MLWSSFLVVLVGVLMVAAPTDQTAIRTARVTQNKSIAAGDLDRVATFWTEDVTVRRALGQPLSGRAAARQALEPPATPGSHLVYQRLTKDVEVSRQWLIRSEVFVALTCAGAGCESAAVP